MPKSKVSGTVPDTYPDTYPDTVPDTYFVRKGLLCFGGWGRMGWYEQLV